jgi:uroporphyrin-III C-methyltransferase/precorrin-2 dehydrogenase/sirohydrochlorin ferrochelatase
MHSLPIFLRLTGRPVILVGAGDAAAAKRRLLERAGALVMGEDGAAMIAIVALEDREAQEAVAARLRARGMLLNVVDRPDLCDFTMPAIVDRDPVIVAIGTGGASAGLAKAVRQRIERLLPSGLGRLADALGAARGAIRARWPEARDRRGAIDVALADGGMLDPLIATDDDAVDRWLAVGADNSGNMTDGATNEAAGARTEIIILQSVDPDMLTLRDARLLGEADIILYPPRTPAAILTRARADAVLAVTEKAALPSNESPGLTVIVHCAF